jgi:hypothetical protein
MEDKKEIKRRDRLMTESKKGDEIKREKETRNERQMVTKEGRREREKENKNKKHMRTKEEIKR